MNNSRIHYFDRRQRRSGPYRTGVSLHSHTLHSKEGVGFLRYLQRRNRALRWLIHWQHSRRSRSSLETEFASIWWTPPLSAHQALDVEKSQIEDRLQVQPLVSISDHDNLEAPLQLQLIESNERVPVSVEWTAPLGRTYIHLGIHNLPRATANETFAEMARYTAAPRPEKLDELMAALDSDPGVLIVFNHPLWDQTSLGRDAHRAVIEDFLRRHKERVHALEINGMRSWSENSGVVELSKAAGLPLISGGDRHGREPNATLNLTNASTFAEFVEEVRKDAFSEVLVMPQYRDPLPLRFVQTMWDVLKDDEDHALGWTRGTDRIFRSYHTGDFRSFTEINRERWGENPFIMRQVMLFIRTLASPRLRPAWQAAFARRSEAVL